jgi:hypothetical protein
MKELDNKRERNARENVKWERKAREMQFSFCFGFDFRSLSPRRKLFSESE